MRTRSSDIGCTGANGSDSQGQNTGRDFQKKLQLHTPLLPVGRPLRFRRTFRPAANDCFNYSNYTRRRHCVNALPESPATLFVRPAAISVGPAALPTFSGSKAPRRALRSAQPQPSAGRGRIKLNGRMGRRFSNRRSRRAVTAARRARRTQPRIAPPAASQGGKCSV